MSPVEPRELVQARARGRIWLIGLTLGCMLGAVGLRGAQLCLAPSERTQLEGSSQRWGTVMLSAHRGEIRDRNGELLAQSVGSPVVACDPGLIEADEVSGLARQLATLLDRPFKEMEELLSRDARYVKLADRVHPDVENAVASLGHRGVWTWRETRRFYPEGELGSQVLGFVNSAGAGQAGLERSLDHQLRGASVLVQRRRDRKGLDVGRPGAVDQDPNRGMSVQTTIDRTIQLAAEKALEGAEERSAPKAAHVVVVDVRSGDVLAMANTPTYNPNRLSVEAAPRRNHTIEDAIEPGSVFKPFTVAAALDAGVIEADDNVDCEGGTYYVGRTRIRDDHPHGVISLGEVIKYSSNIGSAKLALRVGAEKFLAKLHDFGFASRTGVDLPGERRGFMRRPDSIRPIELATTAYGQGVTATPLQLAMAIATLANGGVRMKPRLVTRVEDAWGVPDRVVRPEVAERVVSEETARAVTKMMVTVTERGGTGTRARVEGYRVAGKTGTAEKVVDGRYTDARIGSFLGFVPADDPVLAIAVSVDEPSKGSRYGGTVAGPVFSEVAEAALRHLGIAPDTEEAVLALSTLQEGEVPTREPLALEWTGEGWRVPDLTGRPVRDVLRGLGGTGLSLEMSGSGMAISQNPAPGVALTPGSTVAVRFE